MAATLTDELTRVSVADIEKWEEADGTVYVYGRCTTPEIDTDDQRVSAEWSGPALKEWMATAPTVRVQHNPQRDPAGSGVKVDVNRDGDGAHWLKAAVDEPVAQRLVKKGHLRAFSVGIARPVIERDVTGKARGGIISGGKIVEVSLVDSPANRSCFLEIAKSAADGTCEFTGKVYGDDEVIRKAIGGDLLAKAVAPASLDTWSPPADLSITFTPADMAKLFQGKIIEQHYDDLALKAVIEAEAAVYKRDIDTATRRRLRAEGNALPNLSYPIENAGDLDNAARLARSGHGDVAAARRLIARRARELGVANPLDEGDAEKAISEEEAVAKALTALDAFAGAGSKEEAVAALEAVAAAVKEAEPEITKDPEPEAKDKPKPVKKAKKKPKKLPPWLNKPKDGDGDGDSDDDGACKQDHAHTEKCHTTPAEAAGVSGSHPMQAAPVPELQETPPVAAMKAGPTPASAGHVSDAAPMTPVAAHREPDGALNDPMEADAGLSDGDSEKPTRLEAPMMKGQPEVSAMLRFKAAGIDPDLGRLHDLTCPAYHPDEVAKYHPFADFTTLIDERAWMRKALAAACGPAEEAKAMAQMWNSVTILRAADPAMLNDFRLQAHKAFRDANPGPSTYPAPGSMSPQRYNRPLVTDGHEASSPGHSGPGTSPEVAGSAPNAHSFDRPPLAAGHQSPSPSHMKQGGGEYPAMQGQPVQLSYAHMEKDQARMALVRVHDQLGRQFPEVCPLDTPTSRPLRAQQPEGHPVPAIAGIGKTAAILPVPVDEPAPVAVVKAQPESDGQFMDADVYKGFKKMRKKLGKKVLSGKMTVDEARSRMGRQFAQKGAEPQEPVQKGFLPRPREGWTGFEGGTDPNGVPRVPVDSPLLTPDLIKAAVAEALRAESVPLEPATVASFDPSPAIEAAVTKATSELKDLLVKQQATFETKLAEQQKVIDAIADQPDPSTAAFSGLAFRPAMTKAARPAGVTEIAESHAAQARLLVRQELENTYYNHSTPAVREAAAQAIARLGSGRQDMT